MHNPENSYINKIDNSNVPPPKYEDIGFRAEEAVIDYLNKNFGELSFRFSTPMEDSGRNQIGTDKQIDAVAYLDGKPYMSLQITTARDKKVQAEKLTQLREHPFVRLDEMNAGDTAVPKVLIGLDPKEVEAFLSDNDFSKHDVLTSKIKSDITNCLKFDLTKTKNTKEQERIASLLAIFTDGTVH